MNLNFIALGYMGLILVLSATPDTGAVPLLDLVPSRIQDLLHVPVFGLLAILWILALRSLGMAQRLSLLVAFLVTFAFSAITEAVQAWVPGRCPSLLDLIFDVAGIMLFIGIFQAFLVERVFSWVDVKRTDH